MLVVIVFFCQKPAYELRMSDWSSDGCSSDLVGEPSVEDAVKMLEGLRARVEDHHQVQYTRGALRTAVELSHRHITDRHLPDKAIDVIDEAAARLRLLPESKRRKTVQVRDIEETVARIARIPPNSVSSNHRDKLATP